MDVPKNQYLFDWKTFYKKKCCSEFPPQLCYPEFYAIAMTAILNWYDFMITTTTTTTTNERFIDNVRSLCFEYFKSIQNMINLIFGLDSNIRVITPEQIHEIITNYVMDYNISDTSIFFLETILRKDDSSVTNYRTILMDTTLNYYGVDNLAMLTAHLKSKGVCTDCDQKITELPPPSCHYLSYMSNTTPIPIYGPKRWGPVYWIIFHALPQNLKKHTADNDKDNNNNDNDDHDQLKKMVNAYVAIIPFILPCSQCRNHYYQCIKPGELPDLTDIDSIILLYKRIHALVNYNIKRIGSSSSRNTHQRSANRIA